MHAAGSRTSRRRSNTFDAIFALSVCYEVNIMRSGAVYIWRHAVDTDPPSLVPLQFGNDNDSCPCDSDKMCDLLLRKFQND